MCTPQTARLRRENLLRRVLLSAKTDHPFSVEYTGISSYLFRATDRRPSSCAVRRSFRASVCDCGALATWIFAESSVCNQACTAFSAKIRVALNRYILSAKGFIRQATFFSDICLFKRLFVCFSPLPAKSLTIFHEIPLAFVLFLWYCILVVYIKNTLN